MADMYDPKVDGQLRELMVRSDLVAAKKPEEVILADVQQHGYSEEDVFAIKLALEEAMTNAVRHGNRFDASKNVRVRYAVSKRRILIMVQDEGPGFRIDDVPDPTQPENLERPNGRGIMLIRAYMTRVEFVGAGNEVCMIKENEQWRA